MASAVFKNFDTKIGCNKKEDVQIRRENASKRISIIIEKLQCVPIK